MKFQINSKQLLTKLQNAGKVIASKNTLPILDCFKLGVRDSRLYIAASDTENRISTSLEIENLGDDGEIAIEAARILPALKELPDQPLTFEVNSETRAVNIKYHNGKYEFIGQDAADYPLARELHKDYNTITISGQDLLTAINGTLFASADDELRPVMNSVYFDVQKDRTTFVGSDGHKLVRLICKSVRASNESSFVLPKKSAGIIKTLLAKESEDIQIKFDLNNAQIKIGDYTVVARLFEGRYPNYNSVIPTNNPNIAVIGRDTLLAMIKRVSVYANKTSNLVRFDINDSELSVSSQDIDFSTSAEEKTFVEYSGNPITIGFKSQFVIELLESLSSSEVKICMSEPSRAALILPTENVENFDATLLLMPMMLHD